MNDRQKAALGMMVKLVTKQGGDPLQIRRVGTTYRWTSPEGNEASIGWVE